MPILQVIAIIPFIPFYVMSTMLSIGIIAFGIPLIIFKAILISLRGFIKALYNRNIWPWLLYWKSQFHYWAKTGDLNSSPPEIVNGTLRHVRSSALFQPAFWAEVVSGIWSTSQGNSYIHIPTAANAESPSRSGVPTSAPTVLPADVDDDPVTQDESLHTTIHESYPAISKSSSPPRGQEPVQENSISDPVDDVIPHSASQPQEHAPSHSSLSARETILNALLALESSSIADDDEYESDEVTDSTAGIYPHVPRVNTSLRDQAETMDAAKMLSIMSATVASVVPHAAAPSAE